MLVFPLVKNFKITAKEKLARVGSLKTAHGVVDTPVFMAIGTQGSVKALGPDDLKNVDAQIILGNTYHLYLRPGNKLIKKMGGLHKFMNWDGPILTDSGGFQAFSLGAMIEHGVRKVASKTTAKGLWTKDYSKRTAAEDKKAEVRSPNALRQKRPVGKIDEEGVHFTSHLDGSKHLLSPEKSMEVQLDLGSDICLVLDELLSPVHSPEYVKESLERTHRWEIRSKDYFEKNLKKSTNPGAQLFGIVQGVQDKDIRVNEARWVASQDFDGVSIGGSFGASQVWGQDLVREHSDVEWANLSAVTQAMEWIVPNLPEAWPKHALGIGEVRDLFECIERGIDMFDCVAPTRRARNGSLYISPKNGGKAINKFTLNITNSQFKEDQKSIDPGCKCYTCQNFSRGYLRHLYLAGELLYYRLATIHNVYFMVNLTIQIRESIIDSKFNLLKNRWL